MTEHLLIELDINKMWDKGPKGGTPIKCKGCGVTGVYVNDDGYCAVCEDKA